MAIVRKVLQVFKYFIHIMHEQIENHFRITANSEHGKPIRRLKGIE